MIQSLLTVIFCLNTAAHAQQDVPAAPEHYKFSGFLTNLPEDWSLFAQKTTAPENRLALWSTLGLTAALITVDNELWKESERWKQHSGFSDNAHWQGVNMGDGYFQFAIAGAFGAYSLVGKSARAWRTTSQIVEVILSTGAVVQLIKHVTGRESPFKSTSWTGKWEPFPEQGAYYRDVQAYDAMPSGHLATAYATFMVIWENYPEQTWIPWIGYPTCFWVAEGLAGVGIHWWSDYPIGIALGHAFAKIVTSRNHTKASAEAQTGPGFTSPMFAVLPSREGSPLFTMTWGWR